MLTNTDAEQALAPLSRSSSPGALAAHSPTRLPSNSSSSTTGPYPLTTTTSRQCAGDSGDPLSPVKRVVFHRPAVWSPSPPPQNTPHGSATAGVAHPGDVCAAVRQQSQSVLTAPCRPPGSLSPQQGTRDMFCMLSLRCDGMRWDLSAVLLSLFF